MKKILNFALIILLSFSLMSFGLVSNPKHSDKQSIVKTSNTFNITNNNELTLKINESISEDVDEIKPESKSVLTVITSFFNTLFSVLNRLFKL